MDTLLAVAQPFGPFLLDATLKSSLLLALVALADHLLPSPHAAWRNLLWRMGLIGLLLIPVAAALLPVLYVPLPSGWSQTPVVQAVVQPVPAPTVAAESPGPVQAWRPAVLQEPAARARAEGSQAPAPSSSPLDLAQLGVLLAAAAYLAGALFLAARIALGLLSVSRLRRRAIEITDEGSLRHLRALKSRLGIRAPVLLAASTELSSPTQVGFVHPLILLPAGTPPAAEEGALNAILAHELAHVHRRDYLFNLVTGLVLALHWFNPLAWLGVRRLRQTSEQACDDWTVEMMGDCDRYARTLVEVAAGVRRERTLALGASMATPSRVGRRVERIIALGGRVSPRTSRLAGALCALALMGGAAALGVSALYAKPADPPGAAMPAASNEGGPAAYAIPLNHITIDGNLDDWPQDLIRYPLLTNLRGYGYSEIDGVNLANSADLNAHFMIGFDPLDQLLYLAVEVQDDILLAGNSGDTDACEVYVDVEHSRHRAEQPAGGWESEDGPRMNSPTDFLWYVGVPGIDSYDYFGVPDNPGLFRGAISKTRTHMAFARRGDWTTYEWAIQAFDHYPDTSTSLYAGKTLGMEMIVVDQDQRSGSPASICWGTSASSKYSRPDLFGEVVLIDNYATLGTLSGTVVREKDPQPMSGLVIDIYGGNQLAGSTCSDPQGHYLFRLPPGTYSLKVRPGQGAALATGKELVLRSGAVQHQDLRIPPLKIPETLTQLAAAYRFLRFYQATIHTESHQEWGSISHLYKRQVEFAFERPNRFRVASSDKGQEGIILSDGITLSHYNAREAQYVQELAQKKISVTEMRRWLPSPMGLLVPQLLTSDDPLAELLNGVDTVEEKGVEDLDGDPVVLVDLHKSALSLGLLPTSPRELMGTMRLWIGAQDHLIHQASYATAKGELIAHHHIVEPTAAEAESLFTFVPPTGARLVRQFPLSSSGGNAKSHPAPDFALRDLENREVKLSDFAGEVLLLSFWASWSSPSRAELALLDSLQSQYHDKGLRILALSIDNRSEAVRFFAWQHPFGFPLLMGDDKVLEDYGFDGFLPRTFAIDKKGMIRDVYTGNGETSVLRRKAQVEQLLAE